MIEKILVTVKTYPHPSETYQELVCTAGVRADGSFVRLYPVDFRYRPLDQWYKKYQWIEVDITKNPNDPRPESYRPNLDTIQVIGEPLSSKDNWKERKRYVLARPLRTMCGLREAFTKDKTSLGIIKPYKISSLEVEEVDREWDSKHQNALAQYSLFDQEKKPLTKIPYRFAYRFQCDRECPGHNMSITDWELGSLYLKEAARLGTETMAIESVRSKFFDELCASDRDTHFFVGNTYTVYNSWIVLGVFWPKQEPPLLPPPQTSMEFE